MEKIIRKVQQYKQVSNGTRNVEEWVSSDGNIFSGINAEKDCKKHEQVLLKQKFLFNIEKYQDTSSLLYPDIWYHPKNEEELLAVMEEIGYNNDYDRVYINKILKSENTPNDFLKAGDWICAEYQDGGDYRGYIYIYTADYVKSSLKFLDDFK
jgi:hypothetical protein